MEFLCNTSGTLLVFVSVAGQGTAGREGESIGISSSRDESALSRVEGVRWNHFVTKWLVGLLGG